MQMAISTKVNGSMIKHMAKELTLMQTEHITMVIGLMISSMDWAWNLGLMVLNTKDSTGTVRNMEKESLPSLMEASMKANSIKMRSVAEASTTGQMASITRANGIEIKCMDMVLSCGKTAKDTKESFSMTNVMVRAHLHGLMVDNT